MIFISNREAGLTSPQGTLLPALIDFIEGTRTYLESLSDPSALVVTMFGCGGTATLAPSLANQSIPSATAGSNSTGVGPPGGGGVVTPGGSTGGPTGVVAGQGGTAGTSAASAASTTAAAAAASAAPHTPTGVDPALLTEMRLYFCVFIRDLIRHLPRKFWLKL